MFHDVVFGVLLCVERYGESTENKPLIGRSRSGCGGGIGARCQSWPTRTSPMTGRVFGLAVYFLGMAISLGVSVHCDGWKVLAHASVGHMFTRPVA